MNTETKQKDTKKDSEKDSKNTKKRSKKKRRSGRGSKARRSEFDQKIVDIRRVTRVVAGGRRFSFSVTAVVGDHKGKVGVGIGKSSDTSLAIGKAMRNAEKNAITISRTKDGSIPHDVKAKFKASEVIIRPAAGRGLVAGSSVRTVLELAGVTDVNAKLVSRSKNKLNNARAAIKALQGLEKVNS
ncbi:MAG: 30S ribosomal protein S5 [Candidatus Paceibacterota bacterium]